MVIEGLALDGNKRPCRVRTSNPGHCLFTGIAEPARATRVIESLLAEASLVLQDTPKLEAAWCGIGPKPVPGDGESVLGRVEDVAGLYVAFTHSGATLGLIAGELLAYEIMTGAPHPMLDEFNVRRFGDGGVHGVSRRR